MKRQKLLLITYIVLFSFFPSEWCLAHSQIFKMHSTKGRIESTYVGRFFSAPEDFKLNCEVPIDGFSVSGKIIQTSHNSFIRILLEDNKGKTYLVIESSRIFNDLDTVYLSNYCEETRFLNDIIPIKVHVCLYEASLELTTIHMRNGVSNIPKGFRSKTEYVKQMSTLSRKEQAGHMAGRINEYNVNHGKLWRADTTKLALLSWEDRKRILGMDNSSNSQGYEYYSSGIFEFGETETIRSGQSASPYVDTFDWRKRHGKNWMTSVKDQETGNSCWAFAAIGLTEALVNLYYNRKIDYDLSEQEVVSCSGCGSNLSGGYEGEALNWVGSHGVSEEAAFRFSNSDEPCSNKGAFNELISFNGSSYVSNHTINNNDEVKRALIKYGPLVSGFQYENFWGYHGHAMTLVGYATIHEGDTIRYFESYSQSPANFTIIQEDDSSKIGKTYWIFKNSYVPYLYYDHEGYSYILFNDQSCFRTPYYANVPVNSQVYSDSDISITDADGDGYYYWGIGSRPSHCPSWAFDEADGDDSDINSGPMDEYGHLQQLSCGQTISSATAYTGYQTLSCRLGIVDGGTLTISGTTTMSGHGQIRVCEGGTLIVDGGTLQDANLVIVPGGTVVLRNGGVINMAAGKTFEAPVGAVVNIDSGEIN